MDEMDIRRRYSKEVESVPEEASAIVEDSNTPEDEKLLRSFDLNHLKSLIGNQSGPPVDQSISNSVYSDNAVDKAAPIISESPQVVPLEIEVLAEVPNILESGESLDSKDKVVEECDIPPEEITSDDVYLVERELGSSGFTNSNLSDEFIKALQQKDEEIAELHSMIAAMNSQLKSLTVERELDELKLSDNLLPKKEVSIAVVEEKKEVEDLGSNSEEPEVETILESKYFPFVEVYDGQFECLINKLLVAQKLFDYDIVSSESRSKVENLIGTFSNMFTSEDKILSSSELNMRYIERMSQDDIDSAIKNLPGYPHSFDSSWVCNNPNFGEPSALLGTYLLHFMKDDVGCSNVYFDGNYNKVSGKYILGFPDFSSIYCSFNSQEYLDSFRDFMSSYTNCKQLVGDEDYNAENYMPFKNGILDILFETLDNFQMYQLYEDYKEDSGGFVGNIFNGKTRSNSYGEYRADERYYGGTTNSLVPTGRYPSSYNQRVNNYSCSGQNEHNRSTSRLRRFADGVARVKSTVNNVRQYSLENRIDNSVSLVDLSRLSVSLFKKIPRRVKSKVRRGVYYSDEHIAGLGSLGAYKVLQLALSRESGVRDIVYSQDINSCSSKLFVVRLCDFSELYLTFSKKNTAELFVEFFSEHYTVEQMF